MKNIFSLPPKKKVIILLLIVVVIILFFKINSRTKVIPPEIPITPTQIPTIYPTLIPDSDFETILRPTITQSFPLISYVPYKSSNFSVDYTKALTLIVILKKDTPQIRQEVLDWIRSKGVDPSTHTIQWKVGKI